MWVRGQLYAITASTIRNSFNSSTSLANAVMSTHLQEQEIIQKYLLQKTTLS